MSGLTNMKRSKKERKNAEVAFDEPQFPFGLSITLDDESLSKLGIKALPAVGEQMIVVGVGPVESVSQNERSGSKRNRSVTIQLEQLEVGAVDDDSINSAEDAVSAAIKDV